MKRLAAAILALLLLTGCAPGRASENAVTFYYPRKNPVYSFSDLPIGSEQRDIAGESLEYVLRLYLLGPTDENLEMLFPSGTRLQSLTEEAGALTVFLSPGGNRMQDIDFTLAGACLAKTCFAYGSFSTVTIRSGDRDLTLQNNDLLFRDDSATLEGTEKEEKS